MVKQLELYSLKQMYDLLELLDTHDALKQIAHDRAIEKQKQNK